MSKAALSQDESIGSLDIVMAITRDSVYMDSDDKYRVINHIMSLTDYSHQPLNLLRKRVPHHSVMPYKRIQSEDDFLNKH